MLFDSILVISIIFFMVIFIFCYNKLQTKKEKFNNYFHITKPDSGKEYSYTPDQVILTKNTDSIIDKDIYFGALDHQGVLEVNNDAKLYIGNSVRADTAIDASFLDAIERIKFPYIEERENGDRLRFNKESDYIDANNLRALKGQKLVPLYTNKSKNTHALKIVADTDAFQNPGFKCGYLAKAQHSRGKITGIIPYGNEY